MAYPDTIENDQLQRGIVEEVAQLSEQGEKRHYIPHHSVVMHRKRKQHRRFEKGNTTKQQPIRKTEMEANDKLYGLSLPNDI